MIAEKTTQMFSIENVFMPEQGTKKEKKERYLRREDNIFLS